jgi:propanol-preferring alcohol dehydrogenase
LALSLGARWAGGSEENPPERLDAAIMLAPVGPLVPRALGAVRKGGRVVCGPPPDERHPAVLTGCYGSVNFSVANLTGCDAAKFLLRRRRASRRRPLRIR